MSELNNYCHKVLADSPAPHTLFLTEPIYAGQFAAFDNAVTMHQKILEAYAPKGGTIIIKSHPMNFSNEDEVLIEKLSSKYNVIKISSKFTRYPVELFKPLIDKCEVISWSYATLSLMYLYGKKVLHGASDSFFEKYLFHDRVTCFKNGNILITAPLKNLSTWNENGPLYLGSYPPSDKKRPKMKLQYHEL
ncbi:hypothetical protein MTBBW1_2560012 [Desulfamplus magnetovallimortis]|uniref:Capsule polysaccharide biosynthesis protein n=1 Tax=Desulfamplus magnetovallimortis TaxID=1246637 RepID=A0A1W1HEP4_9BACT|nr:hypothetical protein MTBBW1_2560012 [Desulfamplus magnetovallimortis]